MKAKLIKLGWDSQREIDDLFKAVKDGLQKEGYTCHISVDTQLLSTPSAITNRHFIFIYVQLYKDSADTNNPPEFILKDMKYTISFNYSVTESFPNKEIRDEVDKICNEIWERCIEYNFK